MQIWAEPGKIGSAHSQLFTDLISVFRFTQNLKRSHHISPHGQTPLKFGKPHESLVTQRFLRVCRFSSCSDCSTFCLLVRGTLLLMYTSLSVFAECNRLYDGFNYQPRCNSFWKSASLLSRSVMILATYVSLLQLLILR